MDERELAHRGKLEELNVELIAVDEYLALRRSEGDGRVPRSETSVRVLLGWPLPAKEVLKLREASVVLLKDQDGFERRQPLLCLREVLASQGSHGKVEYVRTAQAPDVEVVHRRRAHVHPSLLWEVGGCCEPVQSVLGLDVLVAAVGLDALDWVTQNGQVEEAVRAELFVQPSLGCEELDAVPVEVLVSGLAGKRAVAVPCQACGTSAGSQA